MSGDQLTFYAFEYNDPERTKTAPWPKVIGIKAGPKNGGSYGNIYKLTIEGDGVPANACLKEFTGPGLERDVPPGESPLDVTPPASWRPSHDEYEKLLSLNGLDGHAPRAYVYGVVVECDTGSSAKMRPAFVMEDLSAAFKPLKELDDLQRDTQETARFGIDLLEIIEKLKVHRIAHADFSLKNVLVSLAADGRTIQRIALVDFGQSKVSDEGVTPRWVEPRMGTLPYAAPEILPLEYGSQADFAKDHARYFEKRNESSVDLWSLGALLYHVRTGRTPPLSVFLDKKAGMEYPYYIDAEGRVLKRFLAYEIIVKEKLLGLNLDGLIESGVATSPQDKALSEAIRICTMENPDNRDIPSIKKELEKAAGIAEVEPRDERLWKTPEMPAASQVLAWDKIIIGTPGLAGKLGSGAAPAPETAPGPSAPVPASASTSASQLEPQPTLGADNAFDDPEIERALRDYLEELIREGRLEAESSRIRAGAKESAAGAEAVAPAEPVGGGGAKEGKVEYDDDYGIDLDWNEDLPKAGAAPAKPSTTSVLGAFYSMTRPGGAPFSVAGQADLLVIGPSKEDVILGRTTIRGTSYRLERVGGIVDMMDRIVLTLPNSRFRKIAYVLVMGEPRPATINAWFSDCYNLRRVIGVSKIDTSQATHLDWVFDNCRKLKRIDLSMFNTKSVTTLDNLFFRCGSLVSADLSGWDTSNVTSFRNMFYGCHELKSVDLGGFSARSLKDATDMFGCCGKLERIVCSPEFAQRLRKDSALPRQATIVEHGPAPKASAHEAPAQEELDRSEDGSYLDW